MNGHRFLRVVNRTYAQEAIGILKLLPFGTTKRFGDPVFSNFKSNVLESKDPRSLDAAECEKTMYSKGCHNYGK